MSKINGLKTYLVAILFTGVNALAAMGIISTGESAAVTGAVGTISDCVTQSSNAAQLIWGTVAGAAMAVMRFVTQFTTMKQ